jgi:hypothetical protein
MIIEKEIVELLEKVRLSMVMPKFPFALDFLGVTYPTYQRIMQSREVQYSTYRNIHAMVKKMKEESKVIK